MKIGVLGTGSVGQAIAGRLAGLGHAVVAGLLAEFGWPAAAIRDLGGLSAARGLETYLPLWVNLFQSFGTGRLNIRVMVG